MPELVLEVGCEELPATFVRKAYTELGEKVASGLIEAGVLASGEGVILLGTPRRLIVGISDIQARQADSVKELRGPGIKGAYDAEGKPTPALLGFCRGQGVDVSAVRNDGQYVWASKPIAGISTLELLQELLPKIIRSLTFEKSMRWGASRMRFARPIRWILAAFDGQPVAFEIEGVPSGSTSRGHRFYAPEPFEATTVDQLVSELRARKVEPDPALRKTKILEESAAVAQGSPDLPEALVDENTFLTEWPSAVLGEFLPEFLSLPDPVLVTAMAKHEKMFPVRDAAGKLTNKFVFVRNSGENDSVRKGCEWVLNARFNDARFFHAEDKKRTFDEFLGRTSEILFQASLGTVRQRADRLSQLCEAVARATGATDEEIEWARLAGHYAKADLSTGLVGELTSLQGIIGGEYAMVAGLPDAVCTAIAEQYDLGKNPAPQTGAAKTAVRLVIADQLDKLAGYLGIGLAPSGSSDPYALRRAGSLLIEAAWNWPTSFPSYGPLLEVALAGYAAQGVVLDSAKALGSLIEVFASRYQTLLPGVRHDVLDAALLDPTSAGILAAPEVRFRAGVMERLAEEVAFVQTATRPMNIVIAARKKGLEFGADNPISRVEHSALESAEGLALLETVSSQQAAMQTAFARADADALIEGLRKLQAPINRFFDSTMVMVEEPEVRYSRLTLLHAVSEQLLLAGDFSKLVIDG